MPEDDDDDEDADEQVQNSDYGNVYPYVDGDDDEIDAPDEPNEEDSGEEETVLQKVLIDNYQPVKPPF